MIKNNRKKSRLKWVLIFSPIIVMAIVIGVFYAVVLSGLGTNDNNPKKQLVNSVIKDAILNPTELGETIDSLSITNEEDTSGASTDSTSQKKDDSSITKSGVISEIKDNYSNYDLIDSSAENVGGNTYHLIAKVKDKSTGEIKNIEVTTKLSEDTKKLLKNYKNSK